MLLGTLAAVASVLNFSNVPVLRARHWLYTAPYSVTPVSGLTRALTPE